MTTSTPRALAPGRHRAALAIATVAGMLGVAGCDGGRDDAAAQAAAAYLDLIATADADDLETLWRSTVSDDPGGLRLAGELLLLAEERIDPGEIGDPTAADGVSLPADVAVVADQSVQVPVGFSLGGESHEATLVLVVVEGEDPADAASWTVVTPLTGTLAVDDGGEREAHTPDVFIGDTMLAARGEQPLFPAAYPVHERMDPYLIGEATPLAVAAGAATPLPDVPLAPTDEAAASLSADLANTAFADCATPGLRCPLLDRVPGVDTWSPDWWLGLVEDPAVTIGVGTYEATGRYRYLDAAGVATELDYTLTGSWAMDTATLTPRVLADTELR